ncbi:MAG: O-antigen ligase family protein [Rhodoferax sp.]|nr:O-antigen ligase family protein [Rhodoferax sp.]
MALGKKLKSVFPYFVVASLAMSPFLVFPLVAGAHFYDNQRLIQIFCVLFALLAIWFQLIGKPAIPRLFSRPILLLLALLFLLGLVSSSAAYSPRHAFFEWVNLLLLLCAAWLVAAEISDKGDQLLDKLLQLCGLACAVYLLLEITIYISVLKAGIQPKPEQLILGFDNYRFFNYGQTISLPLLGLMAARMSDQGRRLFWWGVTALWWMLLFVSAGRGTFVGVTVAIALAWFVLRGSARAWCRAMLFAGLAGLFAYLIFYVAIPLLLGLEPFGLLPAVGDRSLQNPTSGRLPLWARALEMILEDPWLGAGPMHFAHYGRDLGIGASPHNWPLQIGSEWGLPALLLLCGVLLLALRKLWQLRMIVAAKDQDTLTAWLVTGLAILVDGLVSGLLVMPISQLWIALYAGCAWGWCNALVPSANTLTLRPSRLQFVLLTLGALLLMFALVSGIWPELKELDVRNGFYSETQSLFPRIFSNGNF